MPTHIYKHHCKTLLMYHLVFPAKYRREVFSKAVEKSLREVCIGLGQRYEVKFLEIGMEEDHVHFLVQGIPSMSVTRLVTIIKSITARHIFELHPEVKTKLWGGNLWTSGYYANTVGQYASEDVIRQYVANQGKTYKRIHKEQLELEFGV